MVNLWSIAIDNCKGCVCGSVDERDLDAPIFACFGGRIQMGSKAVGIEVGNGVWCDGGSVSECVEVFDKLV